MTLETILILSFLIIGLGVFYYLFTKRLQKIEEAQKNSEVIKLTQEWMSKVQEQTNQLRLEMQNRLDKNTETLQTQLSRTNQTINERLDKAAEIIGGVQKSLGQVSEINRRIAEFQEALRAPKTRGEIGEKVMYDLLRQIIPSNFVNFQHEFRNGQKVDAVVKTDSGIIPIDSKFPMENFKRLVKAESDEERKAATRDFSRDVKKHIDDIAKKYILPDEGTCDFAIMYINSESVAYEIVVNHPELADYAHQKHVIVVSPQQFNHFLQVIYTTLQVQQINEQAQFVLSSLKGIKGDTEKFGEDFRVLVKHVSNAKSMAETATGSFDRLVGKIDSVQRLTQETKEITPELP